MSNNNTADAGKNKRIKHREGSPTILISGSQFGIDEDLRIGFPPKDMKSILRTKRSDFDKKDNFIGISYDEDIEKAKAKGTIVTTRPRRTDSRKKTVKDQEEEQDIG